MSLFPIMPPKVLVILCKSSSPYNMTEQQTASLCLQRLRGWTTEWLDRGSCSIDHDPFEVRHVGKNQDTGWIFYNFCCNLSSYWCSFGRWHTRSIPEWSKLKSYWRKSDTDNCTKHECKHHFLSNFKKSELCCKIKISRIQRILVRYNHNVNFININFSFFFIWYNGSRA